MSVTLKNWNMLSSIFAHQYLFLVRLTVHLGDLLRGEADGVRTRAVQRTADFWCGHRNSARTVDDPLRSQQTVLEPREENPGSAHQRHQGRTAATTSRSSHLESLLPYFSRVTAAIRAASCGVGVVTEEDRCAAEVAVATDACAESIMRVTVTRRAAAAAAVTDVVGMWRSV